MACSSADRIKFEFMLGGGPPVMMTYGQQVDTTGWRVGAPVALDASGHVTVAASGALASATPIIGIATENSNTTITVDGTHVTPVILATHQSVFSAAVSNAGATTSVPQPAYANTRYPITSATGTAGSSEVWVIDVSATGAAGAYIIGMKDSSTTIHGRVYFLFNRVYSTDSPWPTT